MLKKLSFFFVLFAIVGLLNLFLLMKTYRRSLRQANANKILAEISQTTNPVSQFKYSGNPYVLGTYAADVSLADGRVANLKSFFRRYNSTLYNFADLIVSVSDQYKFDYRLLPAIAMQESNLCKYQPDYSYNCWGWGIYGTTITKFSSYEEAITTVAKGIKENYIDKGLITASAIMEKYTPSSNGSWAHGVNTFLRALE